MKQSLLSKLLRKNVSSMQLGGSAIANLIGLIIVGIALQFYMHGGYTTGHSKPHFRPCRHCRNTPQAVAYLSRCS